MSAIGENRVVEFDLRYAGFWTIVGLGCLALHCKIPVMRYISGSSAKVHPNTPRVSSSLRMAKVLPIRGSKTFEREPANV